MVEEITFGQIVKERRKTLGLTQAELANRASCAPITIRKIESSALRSSVQLAELLALALAVSAEEQATFVRLARQQHPLPPIPAPPPAPDEIGQTDLSGRTVKGYELGERIGSGGFGVVYRAVQPSLKRDVAVKIILPRFANHPIFIRQFEAEAQLVTRLEHPHIVPLYDYWREPDAAYLILRLLREGSLEDLLQAGPLSLPEVQRVATQIALALYAAHRQGVMHRDIKPANVLLDEDHNAYLADFGIATHLELSQAQTVDEERVFIGSPAYVSPEQIKSEPVRPYSDIYCFGLLLYEMLTGYAPFQGPTPADFLRQHLNEPVPLLQEITPDLPPKLDEVVQRATVKQPQARYQDMAELLNELEPALNKSAAGWPFIMVGAETELALSTQEIAALENPFRGLRAFTEADAGNFFGREALVQELLDRLAAESDLARFMSVVGPSGSGKSSVVKAGLIPALRRGGLPGSENWFVVDFTPGSNPWQEMSAALLRVAMEPAVLDERLTGERGLLDVVNRILPADRSTELLLVIDQFEELFTLVEDETSRLHFLESLTAAVLDPSSRLHLLITLRADFTDRPLQYVDFGELMQQRTAFVLPLTPDELTQSITRPLLNLGMQMEPELIATIIQDVGDQPGMLPLLQYAMTELFDHREGHTLTQETYNATGGVRSALARRADELYDRLDPAGQEATRQMFLRLVTLGEGVEDTRRRVLRAELEALHAGQMETVIDAYGRYRLLTFDHDPATRGPTVEVAHEALLREWYRLRAWLRDSREDVRQQRLLAAATAEWAATGHDPGYLLRDARLTHFEAWVESTNITLTQEEQAYLSASLAAREERQTAEHARQQRELETAQKLAETEKERADIAAKRAEESGRNVRRLRLFAGGLALLLLAAAITAWFANTQRLQAQDNFITSERLRLASLAQNALDRGESGALPALLALQSLNKGYSPEADTALESALQRDFPRQEFLGHSDFVTFGDFTADGRQIITNGVDGTIRLWETQSGQELRQFRGHAGPINAAIFAPDDKTILSVSHDGTARLWDVATGEQLQRLSDHEGGAIGVDFSDDGRFAVTSAGPIVRLWDTTTWSEVRRFEGPTDTVFWTDIAPDGRLVASGDSAGSVHLWDLASGETVRQFEGHTGFVSDVHFSPDSHYLLTVGEDRVARIWDVETGLQLRQFSGHTDQLLVGRYSPDGRMVLTGSSDNSVRLWDVESGEELRQILGHTGDVNAVFSPDSRSVLTMSEDRTARLWDLAFETEPLIQRLASGDHNVFQSTLHVSQDGVYPNGRKALLGQSSGSVELWDATSGAIIKKMTLGNAPITSIDFAPDGTKALIGDGDAAVSLWDLNDGTELQRFIGHKGAVWQAVFAPSGQMVLTAGADGTARLWDAAGGEQLHSFIDQGQAIRSAAFSTDGRSLVTGADDGSAVLWDLTNGTERQRFAGHDGVVLSVALSPDGTKALTGSEDETAVLWDTASGEELQRFIGHTDQVTHVAFSPDGQTVLTGSADQTARLWDAATGQLHRQFAGHHSSLQYAGFAEDGRQVITGDSRFIYTWRAALDETVTFACMRLARDFTAEERDFYSITAAEPTCAGMPQAVAQVEPTWTPILATAEPADAIRTVVDLEFMVLDIGNIEMGIPVQHVYLDTGEDTVIRSNNLGPLVLPQYLFSSADYVPDDYLEPPFDLGPFPKGEPLGFTMGEWIAATGKGTYIQEGARAEVNLQFDDLVPNGLYTLWCVTLIFPTFEMVEEFPCGAPSGAENAFTTDAAGHGEIQMTIDAFPPSTDEIVYELAIAYHSDGQSYGPVVGERGKNAHIHMIYDFLPPEE